MKCLLLNLIVLPLRLKCPPQWKLWHFSELLTPLSQQLRPATFLACNAQPNPLLCHEWSVPTGCLVEPSWNVDGQETQLVLRKATHLGGHAGTSLGASCPALGLSRRP